jgi:hypothetical protein
LPDYVGYNDNGYKYLLISDVNSGTIRNIGGEISVNSQNIVRNKFMWETDFSFTYVKNKVIDTGITEKIESSFRYLNTSQRPNRSVVGKAPGMFYGFKTDGVIKNTDQLHEIIRPVAAQVGDINFVDVNGDGEFTPDESDMTWIGDPNPLFTAGLGNAFTYGPWRLNIYLTCSYGNDVYNMTRMKLEGLNTPWINQTTEALNFARVETEKRDDGTTYSWVVNENTSVPRPTKTDDNGNASKISDRFVEDGSYLRIQNISLTYTLPRRVNEKLHINNLRVTANVQNVYTFTNYSGYDPEIVSGGATAQGVDVGRYPSPRMYSLGLNFEF